MLTDLLRSGDSFYETLVFLMMRIVIILFALTVHEVAHGYVAYKMGDPTARNLGRLTLNPVKHLDPIGAVAMLVFGFGWAKPVPINTRNFKNPRVGMAITGAAGPAANLLLALANAALLKLTVTIFLAGFGSPLLLSLISFFLQTAIFLNIAFAVFNLMPIPPFDGSRIFYVFLPPKLYFGIMKHERWIMLAVMALLLVGVFTGVLTNITNFIMNGILFIVGLK